MHFTLDLIWSTHSCDKRYIDLNTTTATSISYQNCLRRRNTHALRGCYRRRMLSVVASLPASLLPASLLPASLLPASPPHCAATLRSFPLFSHSFSVLPSLPPPPPPPFPPSFLSSPFLSPLPPPFLPLPPPLLPFPPFLPSLSFFSPFPLPLSSFPSLFPSFFPLLPPLLSLPTPFPPHLSFTSNSTHNQLPLIKSHIFSHIISDLSFAPCARYLPTPRISHPLIAKRLQTKNARKKPSPTPTPQDT